MCHKTSEGSSRVLVCDLVNGETGLMEYSPDDELCESKQPVSSVLVDRSECIMLSPSGCMDERPCAAKAMCIDDGEAFGHGKQIVDATALWG